MGQNDDKKKWRGFCILLRQLGKLKHSVSEFVIDTTELRSGISCRIFDQSYEEYDNLVTLLQRPGFRHIDLALVADDQDYTRQDRIIHPPQSQQPWSSFQSGLLKQTLEKMENPDHVSIRVHFDERRCYKYLEAHDGHWIPLRSLIPVGKCHAIRHLGISGIIVNVDELVDVLDAQPRTLRSVELSYLIFTEDRNFRPLMGYAHLLREMRRTLRWHERVEEERPVVMIHIGSRWCDVDTFGCVDYYIHDYLYARGLNAFYFRPLKAGLLICTHRDGLLDKLIIGRRNSPKPSCYL